MQLTLVGLSHKSAPVSIREKLAFSDAALTSVLAEIVDGERVFEAVVVSTCNRTEVYAVTSADVNGPRTVTDFLAKYQGLDGDDLAQYLYISQGEDVIRHLFRVVSSLESMVLGEAQIQGQIKTAYDAAFEAHATGRIFNKLFRQALTVGARVRSETEIGENAVSISYAAIELAKRVFDSLEGRTIFILGAGKMSELTARHLQANGVSRTLVANRTFERAVELANKFNGEAVPFEDRYDYMRQADIVVSATAAKEFVITKDALAPASSKRRDPLFLIDIAVPRDIDPACADLKQVFVYDVDALQGVVTANLEEREREARRAEVIIEEEMGEFEAWLESMEVVPTIAAIRAKAERIRSEEMQKAYKRLGNLSEKDLVTVEKLTEAIVSKMLHEPTAHLREASGGRRGVAAVETARFLYGIEEEEAAAPESGFRLIRSLLGRRPAAVVHHDHLEAGE